MLQVDVDARGARCPLPLLRARQALEGAPEGGCVVVLSTDPGSGRDFRAFAKAGGHGLLVEEMKQTPLCWRLRLTKGGGCA